MPPPLSAYFEAAKRFAKLQSDDVTVLEDFYVRIFPDLPDAKKQKILKFILAHDGPARKKPGTQAITVVIPTNPQPQGTAPPTTPPKSRPQHRLPTISTLPLFFGAALAKSFEPVARMPRRLS